MTVEEMKKGKLKKGFTTGACAAAAATGALLSYLNKTNQYSSTIILPNGKHASFKLVDVGLKDASAYATVIKDAGDDPDVTHGAAITVVLNFQKDITNSILFTAGLGVGTVTKPGLPIAVGLAAINPIPRQNITSNLLTILDQFDKQFAIEVVISIKNGEKIAKQTWNSKLGIIGGLSILGTTGVVFPYSCKAWLYSITQAFDVALACAKINSIQNNIKLGVATGSTSANFLMNKFKLKEEQIIISGPFFTALLKHINKNQKINLFIAAAPSKLTKIALAKPILHSKKSPIKLDQVLKLFNSLDNLEKFKELQCHNTIIVANLQKLIPEYNKTITKKAYNNITSLINNGSSINLSMVKRDMSDGKSDCLYNLRSHHKN